MLGTFCGKIEGNSNIYPTNLLEKNSKNSLKILIGCEILNFNPKSDKKNQISSLWQGQVVFIKIKIVLLIK